MSLRWWAILQDVLPAEELSIVQVVEIELSQEQVDKLERR